MIFEVEPSQIKELNSDALVQLMKRLLLAECQLVEIPLRAAVVPLQITVPDGGEDGRVEWSGGVDRTNYLPARFVVFQSKAQDLSDSGVRAEVFAKSSRKDTSVPPKLNEAVSDALTRNGSYIVFCSRPYGGQKISRLRKAIEKAIRDAGADPAQLVSIDVYEANRIADWVNTHPSVALWLSSKSRRRSLAGFQSLEGWGRDTEIASMPWVVSDQPRFIPANRLPDIASDARPKGWTFDEAAGEALAHLSDDQRIRSFKSRGIVVQRGRFVQVQPIPLAVRLASQRLMLMPDGRLNAFFLQAPRELQMSLLHRFRWLDNSPAAQTFAKRLLAAECLGNLATLNTKFGSEVFNGLVHIDPDTIMLSLERLLGGLTIPELRNIREGRRHIVWALEKLAFRASSFRPAATFLRKLGAAEDEERIGNNASGQFRQLYHLYLSGTEADPQQRLQVLDEGLALAVPEERVLCVEALGQMLQTGHFDRMGGGDEIGSRDKLEDWSPKTYGDIWDFHRAAMGRLADLAVSDDPLAERAQALLGSHVRGMLSAVPFADVKGMIQRVAAKVGVWPEAIQGVNSWLYFDRKHALPEMAAEIRAFFDEVLPKDPVELVVLYTKGWTADFNDPDTDFDPDDRPSFDRDYGVKQAAQLGDIIIQDADMLDRALRRLVTSTANSTFGFARKLAQIASDPIALFREALGIAEAESAQTNDQFFRGMIAGAEQRDAEWSRECIRFALRSPKLKDRAISIISSGRLRSEDLDLVASLLRSGDVEPWQCATLSYGRGLDHLTPVQLMPLLDELGQQGARGLWAALDIILMYLHGGRPLDPHFARKLKQILLAPELFDALARPAMDGYHLEQAVRTLLQANQVDRRFAAAVLRQLLGICRMTNSDVFYALDNHVRIIVGLLLPPHPKEVWQETARVLTSRDWHIRFHAEHLFEPPHEGHLGGGLLSHLPPDVFLTWVRKAPAVRARVVLKWLPMTETHDGSLTWSSHVEDFTDEFGNQPGVLDELGRRLHPRSWWGSVVPHLEPLVRLLEIWVQSKRRANVAEWARKQLAYISAEISSERKRDDERSAGIR